MKNFIENLQNKPYQTRVKILWAIVGLAGVILIALWALSIKSSVKEIPKDNLLSGDQTRNVAEKTEEVAQAEYIENNSKEFKVYFKITNQTDDILNFSTVSNITLTVKNTDYHPKQVLDRQGNPFVQKILSHTTNFGILVFDKLVGEEGMLIFDQMTYEKSLENIFKDEVELNFEELTEANKLRN